MLGPGEEEGFCGLFSFCNTSCSGECLALLMLSGSGSHCGFKVISHPLLAQEKQEHRARAAQATLFVPPGRQVGKSCKWGCGAMGGSGGQPELQGHSPLTMAMGRVWGAPCIP